MFDVPDELRRRRQWVVWRSESRHGKKTKILYDALTGRRADSTDPGTWCTFPEAEMAHFAGGWNGIGYVFQKPHNIIDGETGELVRRIEIDDGYCGIDLDDSLQADGTLEAWATPIVHRFNTRTEISPSGRGVKMFIRGRLPRVNEGKCRCRTGKIELYDRDRFFTVTSNLLPGTPATISNRQTELLAFYQELFPPPPPRPPRMTPIGVSPNINDQEVIRRASNASNSLKFKRLFYEGMLVGHTSGSEADLALCSLLAFWAGPDPERIDRIFRESALCDEKWLQRADYREVTIRKALDGRTEFYTPRPTALVGSLLPKRKEQQ
jgi:putative DNA primase/helicase